MTNARKRQINNEINRTLDDLKDWKCLRRLKIYKAFSEQEVALKIAELEHKVDVLTDSLFDEGMSNE